MFERLEPARRKPCRSRRRRRLMVLLPRGEKVRRTKRWNYWTHPLPNRWLCPNEAGAPRTEQPFVCASRKRVASQGGDLWIFHAKPVHAVNDQQYTILFVAAAVYFRQCLSDPGDGQPHAAAGVHPSDADRSRLWSDRFANAFGYFIRRNRVIRIEERNFSPCRSAPPCGEPDGFVMNIVIVRSGQDLVACAQRQPMIENSQACRRVLRERDVPPVAANVVGDGTADLQRDVLVSLLENRALNGKQRICIYLRPVLLYRLTHRFWVRGQKKQCEMNVIGSQFKLSAHRFPVFEIGRSVFLGFSFDENRRKRSRSQRQRTTDEKIASS